MRWRVEVLRMRPERAVLEIDAPTAELARQYVERNLHVLDDAGAEWHLDAAETVEPRVGHVAAIPPSARP